MITLKLNRQKFFPCNTLLGVLIGFSLATSVIAESPQRVNVPSAPFAIVENESSLDILHGDHLVTTYIKKSGSKPILWPLISPQGYRLTRDYPMLDTNETEIRDHIHHRSMWLTHGEVNGVNFWGEEGTNLGTVTHQEITVTKADATSASISGVCDWVDAAGKVILKESRIIRISKFETAYVLGFDCVLTAQDDLVDLGDTKEGTMGLRVAESIRVDSGKGGRILDSDGRLNDRAWGQAAKWVDYSGPVGDDTSKDGESVTERATAGMTVFYHPDSFGYPGRWHVRDYGLFAHNPIGKKDFPGVVEIGSEESEKIAGGHQMKPGESIRLRYSILLHDSDWTPDFAERYWKSFISQNQ